MVSVNLWYHVGPTNEEAGRTGFAHLFEHMMFQGSKHVPPDTHSKFLESAGASNINGTTDFDRTNYFETLAGTLIVIAVGDRAKIEPELRRLSLGPVEVRTPEGRKAVNYSSSNAFSDVSARSQPYRMTS